MPRTTPDFEKLQSDIREQRQAREEAGEVARYKTQRRYMDTGEKIGEGYTGDFPYNPPATRGILDLNKRSGADRLYYLRRRNEQEKED